MRAAMHLLATIALVPYLLLAGMFLLLGHALAGGTLASLFKALLAEALGLMPWGALAFVAAVIALAAIGCSERLRRFGNACLALLAAACVVVIVVMPSTPQGLGQWLFLAPCIGIVLLASGLSLSAGPASASIPVDAARPHA